MKVYVPHVPSRYDPVLSRKVPVFDLQPATQYGDLVFLTDMYNDVRGELSLELFQKMSDTMINTMTPNDYLLCVGDPVLIAAAIKYATDLFGSVNVLRWDKSKKEYYETKVEL
jgi:hypothetical protein